MERNCGALSESMIRIALDLRVLQIKGRIALSMKYLSWNRAANPTHHPTVILVACTTLIAFATHAFADDQQIKAKQLFDKYVALERSFNPAIADLFSPNSKIKLIDISRRPTQVVSPSPQEFRKLLPAGMAMAKEERDIDTYVNVEYAVTGANVTITGRRVCQDEKRPMPFSFLVGPDKHGNWVILELLAYFGAEKDHVHTRGDIKILNKTTSLRWSRRDFDSPPHVIGGFDALTRQLDYPARLRYRSHAVQGETVVTAWIDPTGQIRSVSFAPRMHVELEQIVTRAVRNSRWKPGTKDGLPVGGKVFFAIKFTLS